MSALFRSIRDLTARLFGLGASSQTQNGSITITESEFRANARHFIRKSLQKHQVVVRDESGKTSMVLGPSGLDLFPEEEEQEPEINPSAVGDDPHLYDSWLS